MQGVLFLILNVKLIMLFCNEYLVNNNLKTFKVKRDIEQKYVDKFEARHEQMVWEHEKVSSWYQNSSGKVVTTSPWKL